MHPGNASVSQPTSPCSFLFFFLCTKIWFSNKASLSKISARLGKSLRGIPCLGFALLMKVIKYNGAYPWLIVMVLVVVRFLFVCFSSGFWMTVLGQNM